MFRETPHFTQRFISLGARSAVVEDSSAQRRSGQVFPEQPPGQWMSGQQPGQQPGQQARQWAPGQLEGQPETGTVYKYWCRQCNVSCSTKSNYWDMITALFFSYQKRIR